MNNSVDELKRKLMSDFRDDKYPRCNLIEIFIRDRSYYSSICKVGKVDEISQRFFQDCAFMIEEITKTVYMEGFRKIRFESLIEGYANNRITNNIHADTNKPKNDTKNQRNKQPKKEKKKVIYISSPSTNHRVIMSDGKKEMVKDEKTVIAREKKKKPSKTKNEHKPREAEIRKLEKQNEIKKKQEAERKKREEIIRRIEEEGIKPRPDVINALPYKKYIEVYGSINGLEYCYFCNSVLSREMIEYANPRNKIGRESIIVCKECSLAYMREKQKKGSGWENKGYMSVDVLFTNSGTKTLTHLYKTKAIFKQSINSNITEKKQEKSKVYSSEDRRNEAIARIERNQKKRVEIDNIRRETIDREKNKKTTFRNVESIEYKRIKNVPIYVYERLNNRCSTEHSEHVKAYTSMVPTIMDASKVHPINVYYCSKCDRYYVNAEAIDDCAKRHIYFRLRLQSPYTGDDLRKKSELMLYGYSVRQGDMTDGERQGLLKFLIESKMMTKYQIISLLEFFIDFNGKKSNMGQAVRKWKDDIEFVQTYVDDNDPNSPVNGHFIRKYIAYC